MAKKTEIVKIYNCSTQLVQLQLRVPGGDFYTDEQQVRILPGKEAELPKNHLREDQIANLKARRMIKVTYDSEASRQQ